ncbi:MAG: nitroreductase family protein [Chloroflexota bacterium]
MLIPTVDAMALHETAVDNIIRARKTSKVLGNIDKPVCVLADFQTIVKDLIEIAGHAPYHYAAHTSHRDNGHNSPVPWRFYPCDDAACNALINVLNQFDTRRRLKMQRMLAAAGAMVLVTWLPDPSEDGAPMLDKRNIEHIAAASCATQNLLLAATARGIDNYWSSGGVLRSDEMFTACGIPTNQELLGAIFLFPAIDADCYDVYPGKMRDKRGEIGDWVAPITADQLSMMRET